MLFPFLHSVLTGVQLMTRIMGIYCLGVREGFKKRRKKNREFSLRGGGALPILALFPYFFFLFKHGLNHPEMQRNFCSPINLGGRDPYIWGVGTPEKEKKKISLH